MNLYVSKIQSLIAMIEDLRTTNSIIDADSTLITRYFASQDARTDIVAADVTGAHDALVQVIFAYDSGSPTQKSHLFKMLP
jgi:hypothetical protein